MNYITLRALLRIIKYMWNSFYFIPNFSFYKFLIFIKAAFRPKRVAVQVMVCVLEFLETMLYHKNKT